MAIKRRKFQLGVRLKPTTQPTVDNGDISVSSVDNKIKTTTYTYAEFDILTSYSVGDKVKYSTENKNYVCIQAGTGNLPTNAAFWEVYEQSIVTEDQAQDLTNKTIDADNNTISNIETDNLKAGVLVTDISTATSDTELPSALAVKTALEGQNDAVEINYTSLDDQAISDFTEEVGVDNVKDALDILDEYSFTLRQNLDSIDELFNNHTDQFATGAHKASNISNAPSGNLAATDLQGAVNELQTDIDTRALADNGTITNASIETPSKLEVKQDTEANLITYAGTADDGQIVFATDTQKMYQIIDNELEPIGGGGSTSFEISQTTHGFAVGDGIYHNGTTWVKAQADDADTLAYYAVVEVIDANTFIAADFGRVEVPSHGYTVGEYYFLSESTPGLATTTEPGSGFSNPLFYVEDANTLQVKVYRPNAVGDNILLDELSDVSVPSPTDGQALIYDNGNSRWEAKDIAPVTTATAVTYDNSSSGLTATDVQEAIDEVEDRLDTVESNPNNNITALDIDWSLEGVYYKSISAATTFTFSNDSNGQTILIIIENTDASAQAITWPAGVKTDPNYDGNVEPSTESIFTLVKSNGSIYIAEVKELS